MMHRSLTHIAVALCFAASLSSVFAQEANPSSITFEIHSPVPEQGVLTLIDPSQESKRLPPAPYTLLSPIPGNHALFATPPPGTITSIEVLKDGVSIEKTTVPQVNFSVDLDDQVHIIVTHTLSAFGTIGVSSDPSGMPFELTGPANIVRKGTTPVTFERMPIGNYGVRYLPKGCNQPPQQGNELKHGEKIYFTLTIECKTFIPERDRQSERTGSKLYFTDVQEGAWFSLYVDQMVAKNILTGYKDEAGSPTGMFGPSDAVTLAQLTKIVHAFIGMEPRQVVPEILEHPSAANTWFQNYARSAEENDWRVFLDPTLDFNRPATRGEILVTFFQALDIPLQWPKGKIFKDVNRRTPYASAIETAAALGIVEGKTDSKGEKTGFFGPLEPTNRAELAKMMSIMMEKFKSSSSSSK